MTTMTLAVAKANLKREDFQFNLAKVERSKVAWPRKRFNGSVGVRKEVATKTPVEKVN
jgi:hypothetical protein